MDATQQVPDIRQADAHDESAAGNNQMENELMHYQTSCFNDKLVDAQTVKLFQSNIAFVQARLRETPQCRGVGIHVIMVYFSGTFLIHPLYAGPEKMHLTSDLPFRLPLLTR
jgi:hypothetical protein